MKIVEITGLAGSGKSTISRLLSEQKVVQYGVHINWLANAHRLVLFAPKCFATAFSVGLDKHFWTRLKLFLYLEVLRVTLLQLKREQPGILLLDQGPIYIHAFLIGRLTDGENSQAIVEWSQSDLKHWAEILCEIIWLDASAATLLQRVTGREKEQFLKSASTTEQLEFFMRYRDAYKRILDQCETNGIEMLYLCTDELNSDDTALMVIDFMLR